MNIYIKLLWGCSCYAKPLWIFVWACILFLTPWCFVDSTPTNSAPGSSPSSPIGASSALGAENGPSSLPTTTKTEVCVEIISTAIDLPPENEAEVFLLLLFCMHSSIRTIILCQGAKCQSALFVAIKTASCSLSVTLQWKWLSTLTLNRHSLNHMSDYVFLS